MKAERAPGKVDEGHSRRRVLGLLGVGAAAALGVVVALPRSNARTRVLQGGFMDRPLKLGQHEARGAGEFKHKRAFRLDLGERVLREVESQVPIHVLESHPLDANLCVATCKRSDLASLIDWRAQKEVATLALPPGHYFYGHAAFTPDGKTVVLTAYRARSDGYEYRLLLVDVESFSIRGEALSTIGAMHDVVHLGGSEFAVGGGFGRNTPLGVFDAAQGTFRVCPGVSDTVTTTVLGHLSKVTSSKVLAVAHRMGSEGIIDGSLIEFDVAASQSRRLLPIGHADFTTELLSFEPVPESPLVWFSVPERRKVLVWNVAEQRTEHTLEFDSSPRALSVLADEHVVAVATDERFFAFDAHTARRLPQLDGRWPFTRGAGTFCPHSRLCYA